MITCVVCQADISEPLYEFGDQDAPMCQSCYLGGPGGDAYAVPIYEHRPILNAAGQQIGHTTHLTDFGVVFFDGHGMPGEHLTTVYYGSDPAA